MDRENEVQNIHESQLIEWKWSWRDEYLKWLCGYANAYGGTLYIGVNDDGYTVGVKDADELLESLPNKIRNKLGIISSITKRRSNLGTNIRYGDEVPEQVSSKLNNLYAAGIIKSGDYSENDPEYNTLVKLEKETPIWILPDHTVEYIEITVQQYPFAVSCEGRYYKRSGSTLQPLEGLILQSFLLEKAGKTWDAVPVPGVRVDDLSKSALDAFRRKAVSKGRMTTLEAASTDEDMLRAMRLFDNDKLLRAAVLMFHPDPEQYVTGAYIKIAYFAPAGARGQNSADDIIYSDDVHGPLIEQVDKAIDIIYTKYLKALISYDKLQRIETYPWPQAGFREVLLNAVNHKAYEAGIPIQIRVYDDKIVVWNDGQWPERINVNKVYDRHPSLPHNPKMADVFYRSGEIESWGSGFDKIKMACDEVAAPYPIITANPLGGVELECDASDLYLKLFKYGRYYATNPEVDMEEEGLLADPQGNRIVLPDGKGIMIKNIVPANPLSSSEKESVDRMMEILSRELSEKEKEKLLPITEYLKNHDIITRAIVIKITGKSKSTGSAYLNRLVELDVLEKEGSSVATVYRRK